MLTVLLVVAAAILVVGIVRDLWYRAGIRRYHPSDSYRPDVWKK
jgi:uncharacterized membrane protein